MSLWCSPRTRPISMFLTRDILLRVCFTNGSDIEWKHLIKCVHYKRPASSSHMQLHTLHGPPTPERELYMPSTFNAYSIINRFMHCICHWERYVITGYIHPCSGITLYILVESLTEYRNCAGLTLCLTQTFRTPTF